MDKTKAIKTIMNEVYRYMDAKDRYTLSAEDIEKILTRILNKK